MATRSFSPSDEDGHQIPSADVVSTMPDPAGAADANSRIAVWRLDDRDDSDTAAASLAGFASRLTQQLILIYTDRGDVVVDLDDDPSLHQACAHEGRRYLSLTSLREVAGLDALSSRVGLVVLSWPTRRRDLSPAQILEMFVTCQRIMSGDTIAFALVSSAQPGVGGVSFAEHLAVLTPAAHRAGLTQALQIVAIANTVTADQSGDQFRYFATPAEAAAARDAAPSPIGGQPQNIDVVVFTRKTTHHG
jgi:hypothetical protein